jgi:hypothetical protein
MLTRAVGPREDDFGERLPLSLVCLGLLPCAGILSRHVLLAGRNSMPGSGRRSGPVTGFARARTVEMRSTYNNRRTGQSFVERARLTLRPVNADGESNLR